MHRDGGGNFITQWGQLRRADKRGAGRTRLRFERLEPFLGSGDTLRYRSGRDPG